MEIAMADAGPRYPISHFLTGLLQETGLTRSEFVRSLGYRNIERGRRRLDSWIDTGTGYDRILGQIAKAYPDHAEGLQTALTNTKALKATEADAEFYDLCKAQESTFVPFIHADGETRIPSGITLFGLCGGHAAFTTVKIPQRILDLPVEEQLAVLPELMLGYVRQYNGAVPFFGKLTGFRFVRLLDQYRFDSDVNLIEHIDKPFRQGTGWVEIR
jgi:hypothetical protein